MKDFGGATRRRRRELVDEGTRPPAEHFSQLMLDEAGNEMDDEVGSDPTMLDEFGTDMLSEYVLSMLTEANAAMWDEAGVDMAGEQGTMWSEHSISAGQGMYSESRSYEMQSEDALTMHDEDNVAMMQEGWTFSMFDELGNQMSSEQDTHMLQEV
jgi:hypothetical protein